MKRSVYILSLWMMLATIGCSESNVDDGNGTLPPIELDKAIVGTIYQPEEGSDNMLDSYWTRDCVVDIFSEANYNQYLFKGNTGDREGELRIFQQHSAVECDYNGCYALSRCKGYDVLNNNLRLSGYAQATQTYSTKPDQTNNVLYGTSEDGKEFVFRSILGLLQIPLTGNFNVKSIKLKGNNNEQVAGGFYVDTASPEELSYTNPKYFITLDGGTNGIALSEDKPTNIYFWLLPNKFAQGVSVAVTFMDDTTVDLDYRKSFSVEANRIYTTSALSAIDENITNICITHSGKKIYLPTLLDQNGEVVKGLADMGDGNTIELSSFIGYNYTGSATSHEISLVVYGSASVISFDSCAGISKIDLSDF